MATATAPRSTRPASAPRLTLNDAIKGGKGLPSRVVFHGQAGIGKTTFAAQAPSPFFLLSPGETGLHTLIDAGQVKETPSIEVEEWEQILPLIEELTTTEHPHKTLVIDALDGIEKLADTHVCRQSFGGDWGPTGFASYAAGNRAVASGPWRELLCALDNLREKKRMSILCLAHTGVGAHKNPTGSDFNRWVPVSYKDVWALTFAWCDICLYGYRDVVTTKDKGDSKAKGKSGDVRIMATEWNAAWDAKSRWNLPAEIEMGDTGAEAWTNFVTALKAGKAASNGKAGE